MSSWLSATIGELAEKIAMGPFGSNIKVETFVASGIPIISGQHLHKTRLDESSGYNFITEEHAVRLKNSIVGPEDIIFTHAGTIGQVSRIPADAAFGQYVISQRQFYLRLNRTLADPMFVTYWFHGPVGRHRLLMHASQVGVPSISRPATNLRNIEIELPPLPEQRAIAATLGALDDKIELNRKMNATLEAMARALFRDWFVDFGPTRAKIEGRAPYLSPDLWSLFPDRLDAEGKPEGWEAVSFGGLLEATIGGDWGKSEADAKHTKEVAVIRGTDIPDLLIGGPNRVPKRFVEAKKLEKRKLAPGDIVIEVSGGSPTQPTGRSLYFTQAMLDRFSVPVLPTSFCRRFKPKSFDLSLILIQHLQNLYAKGGTWEYQNQSTGIANFQTSYFLEAEKVILPSTAVLRAFSDFCLPIMERMQTRENLFLAQTRDLLLPRLMSGELRVAEAERLASEVA